MFPPVFELDAARVQLTPPTHQRGRGPGQSPAVSNALAGTALGRMISKASRAEPRMRTPRVRPSAPRSSDLDLLAAVRAVRDDDAEHGRRPIRARRGAGGRLDVRAGGKAEGFTRDVDALPGERCHVSRIK